MFMVTAQDIIDDHITVLYNERIMYMYVARQMRSEEDITCI